MKGEQVVSEQPYEERFKDIYHVSAQRTKFLGDEMAQSLEGLNLKLARIADKIKNNQPKKPGALILHFTKCTRTCKGCPHPVWQQWFNPTNGVNPDKWASKKVKYPRKLIPKNATPELRDAVEEALEVIETRRKLLEVIKTISKNITWIDKKYPEIFGG